MDLNYTRDKYENIHKNKRPLRKLNEIWFKKGYPE